VLYLYWRVGMQAPDISAYLRIPQRTIENIIERRFHRGIIHFYKKLSKT